MYRIVYIEEGCKKIVFCLGRVGSFLICRSLYQSPYVGYVALFDSDDNLVESWGVA